MAIRKFASHQEEYRKEAPAVEEVKAEDENQWKTPASEGSEEDLPQAGSYHQRMASSGDQLMVLESVRYP